MTVADALARGCATAAFREMSRRRAISFLLAVGDGLLAAGLPDEALALYRQAAEAGDHGAVRLVVNWPGVREDLAATEAVYRAAIAAGDLSSLSSLAMLRARLGDSVESRELYRRGIDAGDVHSMLGYGSFLRDFGEPGESADAVTRCRRLAADDSSALALLGALLLAAPNGEAEAEEVLRRGAALLENRSRSVLAALLLNRGAVDEASDLVQRVWATGEESVRAFVEGLAKEYKLQLTNGYPQGV
ncbi:hypothetical protein [Actinoplanes sp. ATCC 53533]|uniref:hypothetical protein n=1 Tax=Actinoplanes sp. ATCC 53533 TaxID=1288362 RepID=UPI000F79D2D0|nr:hypothetical protein [Actinoplanes sp. ATCC 53533]